MNKLARTLHAHHERFKTSAYPEASWRPCTEGATAVQKAGCTMQCRGRGR